MPFCCIKPKSFDDQVYNYINEFCNYLVYDNGSTVNLLDLMTQLNIFMHRRNYIRKSIPFDYLYHHLHMYFNKYYMYIHNDTKNRVYDETVPYSSMYLAGMKLKT